MVALHRQTLPVPAPARVLGCGAYLKNAACLLDGDQVWWSPAHGDLGSPDACLALQAAVAALHAQARGPLDALAHDLHPDFYSTRLALERAAAWSLPARAVQHHHAHAAVVQAVHGLAREPLVALALDGVGLGDDGRAWGGEVLALRGARCTRVAHLPPLPLPGGDIAAREPWRLAAALLHAQGRDAVARLGPRVGRPRVQGVVQMLQRGLNCPASTAAGRWFDAAAGLLGLSLRQAAEAEAAVALERAATHWLEAHARPALPAPSLAIDALCAELADETDAGRGAARFHLALAQGLVQAAAAAAREAGAVRVALVGGCFHNRLLSREVAAGLRAHGLQALRPDPVDPGDAGLALGQAWAVAHALQED
jgi:hydrogenase maturation protein HypF